MRFATLDDWLAWQERLHPSSIDLGLDRVRTVLAAMQLQDPPFDILTVGGTNGKGSVAHTAASILMASGQRTGLYTSPHLSQYNERVCIDGVQAGDEEFCAAFAAVDEARGDVSLTYFEFGTLAALEIFRRRNVDVAVLEVGLGGRLDAVNAVDPDVAVVVSVGLDHTDWLGDSIESIAVEKAGIFRPSTPAIFGRGPAPASLRSIAESRGAPLAVGGEDYFAEPDGQGWTFRNAEHSLPALPRARMRGAHQLDNAATAVAAVLELRPGLPADVIRQGLADVVVPGRLEVIELGDDCELWLDVGHNAAAAEAVAAALAAESRPTRMVLAMLADKDAAAFVAPLAGEVTRWYLGSLEGYRGQSAVELHGRLPAGLDIAGEFPDIESAVQAALADLEPGERLLVAGSFHTVGEFRASGLYSELSRSAADRRTTPA
ncbi:MAG: bifunctional tetrahydrofolate synthase/dihydrofolate synthase [Gammaproteobacteria bacterium]|nr:bifunctional tetrahydrofolate synthase/dihydrofolate synthase [Gammaproteobacteria bacterium]